MTYSENEEQIPWRDHFDCKCDDGNSYFLQWNFSIP